MTNCKECKNIRKFTKIGNTTSKYFCAYIKKRLFLKDIKNKECFNIEFKEVSYDDVKDELEKIYEEQNYEKEIAIPLFYKYLNSLYIEKLEQGRMASRFFSDYTYKQSGGGLLKKPYFKNSNKK